MIEKSRRAFVTVKIDFSLSILDHQAVGTYNNMGKWIEAAAKQAGR
jgi:hypothetical protein